MRILIILPYVPYPLNRGTYYRAFHLARNLGRAAEVDLFCLDSEPEAVGPEREAAFASWTRRRCFAPFCFPDWLKLSQRLLRPEPATVHRWWTPEAAQALQTFVAGQDYDLVHFLDLVLWPYVASWQGRTPLVMDRSRVDLLFQTEELRTLKIPWKQRLLRWENWWKLKRYERKLAKCLTATVVCGWDDETFLRREVNRQMPIRVVANGVDETYFSRDLFPRQPEPQPTLLFCGAMDYTPNVDAIDWYFEACDPLVRRAVPERRVWIVGKNPAASVQRWGTLPGVEITGGVPDVRPYYQKAWGQLVPLRIGGGTRLKIVESLAIGCPVISTSIGAQGLHLEHDRHLLLADTPEKMAQEVVRFLQDAALRDRLAEAGRQQVLACYTWERLGRELMDFYRTLGQR